MKKSIFFLCTGSVLALALCIAGLAMHSFRQEIPQNTTGAVPEPVRTALIEPQSKPSPSEPEKSLPATEPPETEKVYDAQANTYLLSFVGDCTLGSDARIYGNKYSFIYEIGTDYDYPFRNVASYFKNDDCTFINLETVLKDDGDNPKEGGFAFRGPTAYTGILTGSGVDAVTVANNHIRDFGIRGVESTRKALTETGLPFVEQDTYQVFTTERGLTIGMYGGFFQVDVEKVASAVREMKKAGAELIVMAIHWGIEGFYRPNTEQEALGRALIDAGVDIVYGCHPHVLQRIEEYNGGVIYYSLGNFCFGGNHYPKDLDTVIVQQQVVRGEDGTVTLGKLTPIPASVSSQAPRNDFQPTPYEEGTEEYSRVLKKLGLAE